MQYTFVHAVVQVQRSEIRSQSTIALTSGTKPTVKITKAKSRQDDRGNTRPEDSIRTAQKRKEKPACIHKKWGSDSQIGRKPKVANTQTRNTKHKTKPSVVIDFGLLHFYCHGSVSTIIHLQLFYGFTLKRWWIVNVWSQRLSEEIHQLRPEYVTFFHVRKCLLSFLYSKL